MHVVSAKAWDSPGHPLGRYAGKAAYWLAEEESTRAAEALPSAARTFESMLGTHPAAVKSRRDYIRALEEFHRRLRLTDPLRQWAGLRKVTMDNGETCFLCNKHA